MRTYMDAAICPSGHEFNIERRAASAGWITPTTCPVCKAQFSVQAGLLPGQVKPVRVLKEADIEKRLVQRVGQLGGEVRKVAWIGRRGAPDRLVMLPPRDPYTLADLCDYFHVPHSVAGIVLNHTPQPDMPGRTIWVELKTPGKAAKFPTGAHEKAQHREHERMRKMGQRVEVIDSYEQIEELLK